MIVIDEEGQQLHWTAVYYRHYSKFEDQHDSFVDAFNSLKWGEDYGELSSVAILGPDGKTLMDKEALFKAQCSGVDPDELLRKLTGPVAVAGPSDAAV